MMLPESATQRCFVALPLPDAVVAWLTGQQQALRREFDSAALRWVQPQQMHLTLLFLGEVALERLPVAQEALIEATSGVSPFELSAGGLGCFPNARRPKVLWCGLQGDVAALQHLQKLVRQSLNRFAERPDNKPFHPHLTLARIKFEDRALPSQMARVLAAPHAASIAWPVREVLLMQSELRREGPLYRVLQRAPLAV